MQLCVYSATAIRIHFFCFSGHLKRFMRGISELAEVLKSAPPTPSPLPLSPAHHLNGPTPITPTPEVPEPQKVAKDSLPLVTLAPSLQEGEGRPRQDSGGTEEGGAHFAQMKNLLEMRMGISRSRETLETSEDSEPGEEGRKEGRSASGSPLVQRRAPRGMPPPPIPKRGVVTTLSMQENRLSHSSSTSSISSTFSEKTMGSIASGEGHAAFPEQHSPPKPLPRVSRKPPRSARGRRFRASLACCRIWFRCLVQSALKEWVTP